MKFWAFIIILFLYSCTDYKDFSVNPEDCYAIEITNENKKIYSVIQNVSFITFCYVLIPKKIIESYGMLNESYFMYCEDLDYCYRLMKQNVSLQKVSNSVIYHKVAKSSGGGLSPFSAYWCYRNEIVFNLNRDDALKYVSLAFIILTRPLIALRWLLFNFIGELIVLFFS